MNQTRSQFSERPNGWVGVAVLAILIAVAIIFALQFGPGGTAQQALETKKSGEELAHGINTRQMLMMISMYRDEHDGKLPKSVHDLGADPAAFLDPWETRYRIAYEDERASPVRVKVTSAGPDQEFGTEDDQTIVEPLPY